MLRGRQMECEMGLGSSRGLEALIQAIEVERRLGEER